MEYKGWKIIPAYRVGWFEASHNDWEHFIFEESLEKMKKIIDDEYSEINLN